MMDPMQGRIAAGIGAWVIGAASATALSLLAVSVFGQNTTASRGPVLSQTDIADALASPAGPPLSPPPTQSAATPPGPASQQPASTPTPTPSSSATSSPAPSLTPG